MGEPDESSITSDFTGVQRARPELRLSSEVETKKESACDAFAGKLITDFVAEKIASQSTEPQIPLEVRLGLCKIKDGRIEVFKPSSFDESRKKAIAYVAKGGPEWQKKDGSPDRPKRQWRFCRSIGIVSGCFTRMVTCLPTPLRRTQHS